MMNVIVFDELEMITPLPDAQRVIIILLSTLKRSSKSPTS